MAGPSRSTPEPRRKRRLVRAAPLRLSPELVLPLRQEIGVGARTWTEVAPVVRSVLERVGYDLVALSQAKGSASDPARSLPPELIAEREPVGAAMSTGGKASVYTLLAAGVGLGIFDALVVGAPLVAVPWTIGALAIAVLFWYRYGRGFESDVIVVVLRADGRLIWFGGRVRSDVRAGDRTGSAAVALPRVGREMGTLAREVAAKLPGIAA